MPDTASQDDRRRDIGMILKDLLKVIKVVSMYPTNNPLPQSMRQSLADKLVDLVQQYGRIRVSVLKDSLAVDNETVYKDRSREENLAAIFFEAGITDFTFTEELTGEDVYKLLEAIRSHMNSSETGDLASAIWEQSINGFAFTTLEDSAFLEYDSSFNVREYLESNESRTEGGTLFGTDEVQSYQSIFISEDDAAADNSSGDSARIETARSDGSGLQQSGQPMYPAAPDDSIESGGEAASPELMAAASAMGLDSLVTDGPTPPDTGMILNEEFKLSDEDEARIAQLVDEDAGFDAYESSISLLKELLHQEIELEGFYESVTICEKTLSEFLRDGRLVEAGHLLKYLGDLEGRIRDSKPLWAERLKDACITAGSRDRLKALSSALNDHPNIGVHELRQYLDNFGWQALNAITDLLGTFEHRRHRETLCDYLTEKGRRQPDIVARGIYDKRWYVVRNSASILARIGDDRSLKYLADAMNNKEPRVRLEIVTALKDSNNDKALPILVSGVADSEREIRQHSIEAILAHGGQAAFETIAGIINDERFADLETDEQRMLLRAFSELGGEVAVSYLAQLIEQHNLWRNSTLVFYRRIAFEALAYNHSNRAEKLLVKLSSNWRPDIRRQAAATLQRRREIMLTGD